LLLMASLPANRNNIFVVVSWLNFPISWSWAFLKDSVCVAIFHVLAINWFNSSLCHCGSEVILLLWTMCRSNMLFGCERFRFYAVRSWTLEFQFWLCDDLMTWLDPRDSSLLWWQIQGLR
jgi:hypothetical protein